MFPLSVSLYERLGLQQKLKKAKANPQSHAGCPRAACDRLPQASGLRVLLRELEGPSPLCLGTAFMVEAPSSNGAAGTVLSVSFHDVVPGAAQPWV